MNVNRKSAAEIATDTLNILEQGCYYINEKKIDITQSLHQAKKNTFSYPPQAENISIRREQSYTTKISVVNETTLMAIKRLTAEGHKTVALNFASAKNPGGGFRSGARAQEESLARSSGLYKCIVNNEMYSFHRSHKNPMYSNYAIYSSNVPVFKDDNGKLLDQPHYCSFITCPAVNKGAMKQKKEKAVEEEMYERIYKVVSLAAFHQNEVCVFGAWGCGVFRNDPRVIARLFQQVIKQNFADTFQQIVFAIIDSKKGNFIQPFAEVFRHVS